MPKEASLPPIFQQYQDKVAFVQRVSPTEYSSTCPICGGEIHPNGEWPDRCRWFDDDTPLGWCRRCGKIFWPNMAENYLPPTREQIIAWKRARERVEEERKRSAERALAHLRSLRLWEQYHEHMDEIGRTWWRSRGLPDSMQDFWELGYCPSRLFWTKEAQYERDVATIPIFDENKTVLNIKNRIVNPPPGLAKYRYELAGAGGGLLFLTDPEAPLTGHVWAIEGEIKAMVTWFTLGNTKQTVVGLPGITPGEHVLTKLKGAERITLVVDPGAKAQGIQMARQLGIKRTWLLETPRKIDDAILDLHLTGRDVARLLAGATPIADFLK